MSLAHVILGLLQQPPRTDYDLKITCFDTCPPALPTCGRPIRPRGTNQPYTRLIVHTRMGQSFHLSCGSSAMTQAQTRFSSFEAYLSYSDAAGLEGRYELVNGELIELPPESELNSWIGRSLFLSLATSGLISPRLVVILGCEVQVPVLQPKDPANRFPDLVFPDLVVLREEHLSLTQRRLTITLEMPPPRLIAEVVSPGKPNQERDYIHKRAQYAALGVPEYWLIDPMAQTVQILRLNNQDYQDVGLFNRDAVIASVEFPGLQLPVGRIFEPG